MSVTEESFYDCLTVCRNVIANISMLYLLDSNASETEMQGHVESMVEIIHEDFDFNVHFTCLTPEELIDLGFIYHTNKDYMFIPIWFLPFIPEDYPIYLSNCEPFDKTLEGDIVKIISNQWVDLSIKIR